MTTVSTAVGVVILSVAAAVVIGGLNASSGCKKNKTMIMDSGRYTRSYLFPQSYYLYPSPLLSHCTYRDSGPIYFTVRVNPLARPSTDAMNYPNLGRSYCLSIFQQPAP
jgi:hypothetical protein